MPNLGKQHFVPQFYLKEFGEEIFVYDKTNDEQFLSNPKSIAHHKDFYKIASDDQNIVEKMFSKFEDQQAPAFRKLIEERNYYILEETEKLKICEFLALMHLRTEEKRLDFKNHSENFLDQYAKIILPPELKKIYSEQFKLTYSEDAIKALHTQILLDSLIPTSIIFYNMRFVMFENKTCFPFLTSDNPLTKENGFDKSGLGNLGLINEGIEFYLPLTPDLILGLLDPITYHMVPLWILSDKMNTIRMNFLQLVYSTRFIYSKHNKFYLIKDMLNSNPHFRDPNRPRSEFLKGTDKYGRTTAIWSAERNLQHSINPTQPIGDLKTWMDPNFVEELHKQYNISELSKKYEKFEQDNFYKDISNER